MCAQPQTGVRKRTYRARAHGRATLAWIPAITRQMRHGHGWQGNCDVHGHMSRRIIRVSFAVAMGIIGVVFVGAAPAAAQHGDPQSVLISRLMERLAAQEALNRALLERVAAMELSLTALAGGDRAPRLATSQEQPSRALELDDAIERIEERVDALPRITGYYDFEFFKEGRPGTFGEFRQHHVYLDFAREYGRFRVLSQVEFEYGATLAASGDNTTLSDARGEIAIEQAWAEYAASETLTLRGGVLLLPNYWNVNHLPHGILPTRRPLMVRNVFTETLVGFSAYGTKYWGTFGLGYDAYVGNGESLNGARRDDNSAKAVGGVMRVHIPTRGLFEDAAFAVQAYTDRPSTGRQTRTWGVESQAKGKKFEVLVEFARRRAEEDSSGYYVQPAYRITDRVAAFYRHDRLTMGRIKTTRADTAGVNLRPIPPVSLKFELFRAVEPGQAGYNGLATSIVMAF